MVERGSDGEKEWQKENEKIGKKIREKGHWYFGNKETWPLYLFWAKKQYVSPWERHTKMCSLLVSAYDWAIWITSQALENCVTQIIKGNPKFAHIWILFESFISKTIRKEIIFRGSCYPTYIPKYWKVHRIECSKSYSNFPLLSPGSSHFLLFLVMPI